MINYSRSDNVKLTIMKFVIHTQRQIIWELEKPGENPGFNHPKNEKGKVS